MVDGAPLMWNRRLQYLDEEETLAKILEAMRKAKHLLP
jgi:hypothetical protein